jgi:hypothetical protein
MSRILVYNSVDSCCTSRETQPSGSGVSSRSPALLPPLDVLRAVRMLMLRCVLDEVDAVSEASGS